MQNDITVITATLGRPSLKAVAGDIATQTVIPHWLVLFDGTTAMDDGKGLLPPAAEWHYQNPKIGMEPFELIFRYLDQIKTPFVTFMDDDNRFLPNHIELLVGALKKGQQFVATSRYYTAEDMMPRVREHPMSEQVDTSNMAMPTQLLRDLAEFWEKYWDKSRPFQDRNICSYMIARGIKLHRIPNAYTVLYRVNPKRMNIKQYPTGTVMYESLSGQVYLGRDK